LTAIEEKLKDQAPEVRVAAVYAIARINSTEEEMTPLLARESKNRSPMLRRLVARGLRRFREASKGAAP
jgi:HEAT repeat protein